MPYDTAQWTTVAGFTSNLPFDKWTGVFGSERLTGALLDRLTHHVHILEMNGDGFRAQTQQASHSRRASTERRQIRPAID